MSITLTPTNIIVTSDVPMPLIPSINIGYTRPIFNTSYPDLNQDPQIRNKLTKYFYYKTLDLWLYEDLDNLLKYLHVSGNKVDLVKNLEHLDTNESQEAVDAKISFIEEALLNKDDMYKILKKIIKQSGIGFIDLPKNEYLVVDGVKHFLKNKFRDLISSKST